MIKQTSIGVWVTFFDFTCSSRLGRHFHPGFIHPHQWQDEIISGIWRIVSCIEKATDLLSFLVSIVWFSPSGSVSVKITQLGDCFSIILLILWWQSISWTHPFWMEQEPIGKRNPCPFAPSFSFSCCFLLVLFHPYLFFSSSFGVCEIFVAQGVPILQCDNRLLWRKFWLGRGWTHWTLGLWLAPSNLCDHFWRHCHEARNEIHHTGYIKQLGSQLELGLISTIGMKTLIC